MTSSSSPSSSSSKCSNGASVCFIPKEWNDYPTSTLECVLTTDIKEHMKNYNEVVGAPISVGGVSAKLEFFGPNIWMRKDGDEKSKPNSKDYASRPIRDHSKI
ncbi:hypothetical protein [Bracoviriform demolitoris]|uniref:Uncharacterized protein K1 n=1 Tax=Microplitis demolitor bracovirus (isolate Webb) TaxID=654919 RepID=YK1_MDBVW|nr:hypothetical protein [Microplitis demolitor]YP_239392.1 hypothetical protein [Bracoviriform demolitoris]Q5I136.1 RecName: Full=Uncharacterized protein K1 [Microplitis demolitor bracovirus (isolate Webb)]AAW51796.1 hypothetical protein [Bracoviriform demolitoris]KAG6558482.1 orph-K1-3 [Microplitis demolitor]